MQAMDDGRKHGGIILCASVKSSSDVNVGFVLEALLSFAGKLFKRLASQFDFDTHLLLAGHAETQQAPVVKSPVAKATV